MQNILGQKKLNDFLNHGGYCPFKILFKTDIRRLHPRKLNLNNEKKSSFKTATFV
jgi:hypothetical protein